MKWNFKSKKKDQTVDSKKVIKIKAAVNEKKGENSREAKQRNSQFFEKTNEISISLVKPIK